MIKSRMNKSVKVKRFLLFNSTWSEFKIAQYLTSCVDSVPAIGQLKKQLLLRTSIHNEITRLIFKADLDIFNRKNAIMLVIV